MASAEFKQKVESMEDEDEIEKLLEATTDPDQRKCLKARFRVLLVRHNKAKEGDQSAETEETVAEVASGTSDETALQRAPSGLKAQVVGISQSQQSSSGSSSLDKSISDTGMSVSQQQSSASSLHESESSATSSYSKSVVKKSMSSVTESVSYS